MAPGCGESVPRKAHSALLRLESYTNENRVFSADSSLRAQRGRQTRNHQTQKAGETAVIDSAWRGNTGLSKYPRRGIWPDFRGANVFFQVAMGEIHPEGTSRTETRRV